MSNEYGIKLEGNPERLLTVEFNGKKYSRFPVATPKVDFNSDIIDFIEKYGLPYYKEGDIFCISAKVISIARGFVVHESKVKVTWLAKLIVKFVKKWPNDIGYSHPRKMQVAIMQAGYPRIIAALIIGGLLRVVGIHGYFYKIAGNNINAIDGFNPVSEPPMNEYAVLPPKNGDAVCDEIEEKFGMLTAILDGNNIDNNVLGMSKNLKTKFSEADLMEILKGNPQGQEDDGQTTPILIVREA